MDFLLLIMITIDTEELLKIFDVQILLVWANMLLYWWKGIRVSSKEIIHKKWYLNSL